MFRFISKYKCNLNIAIRYYSSSSGGDGGSLITSDIGLNSNNTLEKKKFTIKNTGTKIVTPTPTSTSTTSKSKKIKISSVNKLYNQEIKKKSELKEFQFINSVYNNDITIPAVKKQALSVLKETLEGQTVTISIDEAGKGSALGPLVVSVVVLDKATEQYLAGMGVKDSKLLSRSKREALYDVILEQAIYCQSIHLSAEEIDRRRDSYTLNQIEANLFYQLIQDCINALPLEQPCNIYIDSIENNAIGFAFPFVHSFPEPLYNVICETKADSRYVSVGAASILAKVERDRYIQNLEVLMNEKIGSGYPSDSITVNFIKRYYQTHNKSFPVELRKSWNLSFPLDDIIQPAAIVLDIKQVEKEEEKEEIQAIEIFNQKEEKEKEDKPIIEILSSPVSSLINTLSTTITTSSIQQQLGESIINQLNSKITTINLSIENEKDKNIKKQLKTQLKELKVLLKTEMAQEKLDNQIKLNALKEKAKSTKKTKVTLMLEIDQLTSKLAILETQLNDMKIQMNNLIQSQTPSTSSQNITETKT